MAPPTQAEIEAQRERVALAEQEKDLARETSKLRLERIEQEQKLRKAIKEKDDVAAAAARAELSNLELRKQGYDELAEKIKKQKELIDDSKKAASDLADSFGNLFKMAGEQKAPDIKEMFNIDNALKGFQDLNKIMGQGGAGFTKAFGAAALQGLQAYGQAIIDLSIELGNAEIEFMKATGANQEFARSITMSYNETRKFGATMEQTFASAEALRNNFTDFTLVTGAQRSSLVETGAVLEKLGISNEVFAKSVQMSTKALGMSVEQAGQNMLDLERFAENLGVAPSKLAEDFVGASDALAKLGSDGTQAFKNLAIVSKTTGMEIDRILSLTEKFDTFEGAAEQAGKLNAALGGNFVNSMDLMMATDPAERFEMIRDSILDTGLSFDEMSYFQKNFFKDTLGLSDTAELAALMSGEMDLVAGATQQSSQSMLDAKRRAQELSTFQERLNILFSQMIPIVTPVIDILSDITKGLAGSTEEMGFFGSMAQGFSEVMIGVFDAAQQIANVLSDISAEMGFGGDEMKGLAEAGKILGYVLGVVLVGGLTYFSIAAAGVSSTIAALVAAVAALGAIFFTTPFNPDSLLMGLSDDLPTAFEMLASAAKLILNPFALVKSAVMAIGETFSSILGGITEFFTVLADPASSQNVERMAAAISNVDLKSAAAYTSAMVASSGATVVGAVGEAVSTGIGQVSETLLGSENNSNITIENVITLDGEPMRRFISNTTAENDRRQMAGRSS